MRPGVLSPIQFAHSRRGYTVVEVLLVVVILAIVASVAGPRFFDNTAFDERAYYDEVVSALRYAQKVAIASGCNVRVSVTASTYSLSQQAAQAGHCNPNDVSYSTAVFLSTGEAVTGSAPASVSAIPAVTFVYNSLGQTSLAANQTLSIGAHVATIQAESGLVVTP